MSLDQALAAPRLIEIAGREWKLSPLTLRDFGTISAHLRDNAHDPRPAARQRAAALPAAEAEQAIADAANEYFSNTHPTCDQAIAFVVGGSFDGCSWGLWLGLQAHHAGQITRDEIFRHLFKLKQLPDGEAKAQALVRALVDAIGLEAARKNSCPPPADAGETATPNQSTGT